MQTVILFEPNAVVALDVTQALMQHHPRVRVVVAASLAQALHLAAGPDVLAALLHAGPGALESRLGAEVPAGVHVVLMGDAAEEDGRQWTVLHRPFSTEDLWQSLAGWDWPVARHG